MSAPEDLEVFVAREHPRLVGALDLFTGDLAVAEELANEALLRVCERWEEVREMRAPGAWAHRVAMNLATSHFRRRAAERRALTRERATVGAGTEDPDTTDVVVLREALQALAPRERQAVILRYYLGLPAAEVGELLGTTPGNVRVLTHRALAAMRERLGARSLEELGGAIRG